jgi:hypothetical protein
MRLHKKCAVVVAALATGGLVGATSASATIFDCTKPLTHSITLTSNSGCPGLGQPGGLVIGADHITINLNGFNMDDSFGEVLTSNGHRFVTIENGSMFTQGTVMPLKDVHHFTIRNVAVEGDNGGIVLTGGSHNRIVGSSTSTRTGVTELQLIGERGDVLRNDTTYDNCQIELDHSSRNWIVGNAAGGLVLHNSNHNLVVGNSVGVGCIFPFAPYGVAGTGNRNVIVNNAFRGAIALTGFGNVLLNNTIQP